MRLGATVISTTSNCHVSLDVGGQSRLRLVSYAHDSFSCALLVGTLFCRNQPNRSAPLTTADASDAAYVLEQYINDGVNALIGLEGEFSIIIWDRRRGGILIAMRDPLGSWPLYYRRMDDALVLGTNLLTIARCSPRCEVDREYLAEYFAQPYPRAELNT